MPVSFNILEVSNWTFESFTLLLPWIVIKMYIDDERKTYIYACKGHIKVQLYVP